MRHARNHVTPQIRAAILAAQPETNIDLDALRTTESEGLLANLVMQRARLLKQSDVATELCDVKAAVAVENAMLANYTLVAKLLGQLVQVHDVRHSNLLISPDYLKLREALVATLQDDFPDAARAVAAMLHRLESDAAKDISARAGKGDPVVIEHMPELPPPPVPLPS